MPGKRKESMDIREILRQIRRGLSDRAVAQATGVNRKTVARYRSWATGHELLTGPLPPLGKLHRLLKRRCRVRLRHRMCRLWSRTGSWW